MSGAAGEGGGWAANRTDSLDLLERCGVCRERLRLEREPRLLFCLHSFCRDCLRTAPGTTDRGNNPEGGGLRCPLCQQLCHPGDIVENFFLRDTQGAWGSQCCTSCEDNAPATSYCLECSEPLCDTCVEAHQRVKYTKDHTIRATGSVRGDGGGGERALCCPLHATQPLALFCDTCDILTCRDCHLGAHRDHRSQSLSDAARSQRQALGGLVRSLGEQQRNLQRAARDIRGRLREVTDAQKRLQVEVKLAILQVMKELNKRGKTLVSDAQKVTEDRQEQLERQHWALTLRQRQQDHLLSFAARALESHHGTALLLCKRLLSLQLQSALKAPLDPVEPPGEMKFQWDPQAWTKSAESFGTIISERSLPPPHPGGASQGPPQTTVVSVGHAAPNPPLHPQNPPGGGRGGDEGLRTPRGVLGGMGVPTLPQFPLEAEGGGSCPHLSPAPHFYPQTGESPQEDAPGSPEAAVTRAKRRGPPQEEEKFIKKLLVKRCRPPGGPMPPPLLQKVPRVSLERLELDLELSGGSPPPGFRVFPGPTAEEFNVIVIERGGARESPPKNNPGGVKEEPSEAPIGDTKPVGLLPGPGGSVPPCPLPGGGLGGSVPPCPLPGGRWCCRVCCQAGAVVMCDRCQRCFHPHCHLPPLNDVPSPEWICLLCQDLHPPPAPELPPQELGGGLCPQDQKRCQYVLLELLCHEPCRPLHRLSAAPEAPQPPPIDLTLIRGRLQEKLSPPYPTPQDFAHDVWRALRHLGGSTEDKGSVQTLLELQSFFQERLNRAFGDRKFPPPASPPPLGC